ncbi:MAG: TetR/AcrR family transcriptional regulator [Saprospiraceae bacterium]|nr:TetR/AcrR family transcriptional regulator [Saprospiraceae bacterium]
MRLNKIRRAEDIENFKRTVLNTAVELMREKKNWGMVSVNKIAQIMRYTPPNIYHYFENKDDILFHLCQRGSTIIGTKLRIIEARTFSDNREKLFEMGMQFWNFSVEHEELYDLMFHLRQKKLELDLILPNIKIMQDTIKAINPKITTDEEAFQIYQGFHSLIHGFISIKMNNRIPIGDDQSFQQLFEQTLRRYIQQI